MLVSYYNIWRNKTRQSHTFMHYNTGCDHPGHTPGATAKTYFHYLINLIFSLMVSGSVLKILSCHTPLNVNIAVWENFNPQVSKIVLLQISRASYVR